MTISTKRVALMGGPIMTVYLDEVFLVNLLMDFAVLWCAAHLARFSYSWKRLIAGALCGGLYAVIIFVLKISKVFAKRRRIFTALLLLWVEQSWQQCIFGAKDLFKHGTASP